MDESWAEPLLASKLQLPRLRSLRIPRPRLMERLNAGLARPLTLVSAPAGFGKTTLVAEWVSTCGRPAAWLSLDERDSDPARFLAYLAGALQQIEDEAGQATLATLGAARPFASLSALLPQLVNEISAIPEDFVLVLDDYHLIVSQAIHDALARLIDALPRPMHLVIATRADPALPLARLRARGQLNELRQADLRFSPEEAGDLLRQELGTGLSSKHIDLLTERTEGWIAGLQMAALALQERLSQSDRSPETAEEFIQDFSGTHRHILDYLVEEVLKHQPAPVQSFLLQTSILERMSGPLCDAVIGSPDVPAGPEARDREPSLAGPAGVLTGQQRLEALERANLFIAPLDDRREWYRYHRLFADLLRQRLRAMEASGLCDVGALHRRAADWFAGGGMLPEAIHHALAATDFAAAADLIEQAAPLAWKQGELATLLRWMDALPDAFYRPRPLLSIYSATVMLLRTTSFARVEALAQTAAEADRDGRLIGEIALLRALLGMHRGDIPGGLASAQEAVRRLPAGSVFRGLATRALSALLLLAGDIPAAERLLEQDVAASESAGDRLGLSASLRRLGSLAMYRGELGRARSYYERALEMSRDASGRLWPTAGRVLTHLGELALERNDLQEAEARLVEALELLERLLPGWNTGTYILLARVRHAQGDEAGASEALETARESARVTETPMDDVYLEVQAARLAIWRGDLASGERWAGRWRSQATPESRLQERDIDRLIGSRMFNELALTTLARLHLARGQAAEALSVLERLREPSSESGELGNQVEFLVLRALANRAHGRTDAAARDMACALELAEPEGFVRTFIDEGEPVGILLREAIERGTAPEYAARLLAALEGSRPATAPARPGRPIASVSPRTLVEPLTEREMAVLHLLRTSLTTPEIAGELGIAPSTVRTFVKNLYGKLGVHRRLEAVERARELGLLRA